MRAQPSSAPDVPEASAELHAFADAMDEFVRSYRRARGRLSRAPAVPELSLPQYFLLDPLDRSTTPLCVGDVADAAGVTPPSATRMLDGLEARGLIARVRTQQDRRVVRVEITPEGRELVARKRAAVLATRSDIFDQLTPAERQAAARVLHRLAAAMEDLQA